MQEQATDVELYTWSVSPYGLKVYWALVAKGVTFKQTIVHPLTFKEIQFTGQQTIPVLRINDEWKLDSTPIALWIDQTFPDTPLFGHDEGEHAAILEADQWSNRNIIGQYFRCALDRVERFLTVKLAFALAEIMHRCIDLPIYMKPLWPIRVRTWEFVTRHANMMDRSKPILETRAEVQRQMEQRLERTGYLAGTQQLSFADLSAFASVSIATSMSAGFTGALQADCSPTVHDWYQRVAGKLDLSGVPALFPGVRLYGIHADRTGQTFG